MNDFYTYFLIKQIIKILIFLSNYNPISKIGLILLIDIIGKSGIINVHIQNLKNGLTATDRVTLIDSVGSLFSYIQCIIILTENKLVSKDFMLLLFSGILLHMFSIFNYLYKPTGNLEKSSIFPDFVKPLLLGFVIYSFLKSSPNLLESK
jgi:hypothetical protein